MVCNYQIYKIRADVKILAISNVEGCSERVADAFEDTDASIIARDEQGDLGVLQEKIETAIGRKAYDYIIVVVEDHVGASMMFNKSQGVRAALCDSEEDMKLAKNGDANVIIARSGQKKFNYIAEGISSVSGGSKKEARPHVTEARKQDEKPRKQEREAEKAEEEDEEDERGAQGKGIIGKLKNQLGIVD